MKKLFLVVVAAFVLVGLRVPVDAGQQDLSWCQPVVKTELVYDEAAPFLRIYIKSANEEVGYYHVAVPFIRFKFSQFLVVGSTGVCVEQKDAQDFILYFSNWTLEKKFKRELDSLILKYEQEKDRRDRGKKVPRSPLLPVYIGKEERDKR